jgi:hypothetical protein
MEIRRLADRSVGGIIELRESREGVRREAGVGRRLQWRKWELYIHSEILERLSCHNKHPPKRTNIAGTRSRDRRAGEGPEEGQKRKNEGQDT